MSKVDDTVAMAKVLRPNDVVLRIDNKSKKGALMAIMPNAFGNVVWKSNALLPHHINEYLNLMTYSLNAVIVSDDFRIDYEMEIGDSFTYAWGGQAAVEGVIVAFAEYWPGINPHEAEENKYFVIANLNYVQAKTAIEPYEVWYKNVDNASTENIYTSIEDNSIDLKSIVVAKQELIKKKNDPLLQGVNGAMTLGFVVTMTISMIGFIIYWILSIQSRVLQFGIFRAMGMTKVNILSMIAIEQMLISVVAVVMGIVIGGMSCNLFMPLLEVISSAAEQVPPFRLVALKEDYIKLYSIVTVMIVTGFAVIGIIVSKIKIAQVIKLGED